MKKNIALSQQVGIEDITHIIFSESSSPYFLEEGGVWISILSKNLRKGQILMTGAMRQDNTERKLYSTLHAIDHHGKIVAVYDKYRLVPFGEYVPWRNALSFIDTFVGGQDFSSGEGAVTFNIKNTPKVSPLICYDGIFPQSVVDEHDYPEWLLNITNDAWFEKRINLFGMDLQLSSGPYQHFDMIKVRAIENGISMIRVANTGITANIDPFGRTVDSLGLGVTGILDAELYKLK
jgi:apolipoprotein N-acyltransferase